MKKIVIPVLVCINVALLVTLIHFSTQPASAQGRGGATDYVAITAHTSTTNDVMFIVDTGKKKMLAFKFDQTKRKMVPMGGRRLKADFPEVKEPD